MQDSLAAFQEAERLSDQHPKWALANVAVVTLIKFGSENDFDLVSGRFAALSFRIRIARLFASYLEKIQDTEKLKRGVDILVSFRETQIPNVAAAIDKELLGGLLVKKEGAGLPQQADYIKNKLMK